jgi:hypothetical protein
MRRVSGLAGSLGDFPRRLAAQTGVQPVANCRTLQHFDVFGNGLACFVSRRPDGTLHEFVLEGGEE